MLVAAKITLMILLFILVEKGVSRLENIYYSQSDEKLGLKLVEALGLGGVFFLSMFLILS
jgi:hypothetical protein